MAATTRGPPGSSRSTPTTATTTCSASPSSRSTASRATYSLTPTGTVLKEGFCLGDIKLYNWRSFGQSEIDTNSHDNCQPAPQPDGTWRFYEGIDAGWEDSYKWQTSGQYADLSGDGYYVLRVTVNPLGHLLESDSAHDVNNVAYTYFQVTGNDIHQIERGHGTDPWDPHKIVQHPVFGE